MTSDPIQAMNGATFYRGPDYSDALTFEFKQEKIFVGINQLKIIDIDNAANQPFFSADKRYFVLFNGSIYNYKELARKLELKYVFNTHSDTEILLYWLIEHGIDGLRELNGMFAFVFFDRQENRIILSKDMYGIKPMYYYNDDNYFIASSEIKGILASGLVAKQFNSSQVQHYLQLGFVQRPFTFYKNIYELNEGAYLQFDRHDFKVKKFSITPSIEYSDLNSDTLVSKLNEYIEKSISKYLVSDVPIGLFIDNSISSAILLDKISKAGAKNIPVFTFESNDPAKNEALSELIQKYSFNHVTITPQALNKVTFNTFLASVDQPVGEYAYFHSYHLSNQMHPFVKVAILGNGSNELVGNYSKHIAYYNYLKRLLHHNLKISLFKTTHQLLPSQGNNSIKKIFSSWNKYIEKVDKDPIQTYLNFCSSEVFHEKSQEVSTEELLAEKHEEMSYYLKAAFRFDQTKILASSTLPVIDKTMMRNSIEARLPFLDADVKRFMDSLDPKLLFKHGHNWILKKLLTYTDINPKMVFETAPTRPLNLVDVSDTFNAEIQNTILNTDHPVYEWISQSQKASIKKNLPEGVLSTFNDRWRLFLLMKWYDKEF